MTKFPSPKNDVTFLISVYNNFPLSCPTSSPSARRISARSTRYANTALNIFTENFRRATSGTRNINILRMNTTARCSRTTDQAADNLLILSAARAREVDEIDVGDVDLAWVLGASCLVDVKVALIQYERRVGVFNVDVLVCDVVYVAVADVGAGPGFKAGAVLPVDEGHVFDPRVGDDVFYAGVLAN